MTKIEILNKYKKQKHNTYRECDVINAMEKYLEFYKQEQALQLQQAGVGQSVFFSIVDNGSLLEKFKEQETAECALEEYKKMGFPDATILVTVA